MFGYLIIALEATVASVNPREVGKLISSIKLSASMFLVHVCVPPLLCFLVSGFCFDLLSRSVRLEFVSSSTWLSSGFFLVNFKTCLLFLIRLEFVAGKYR